MLKLKLQAVRYVVTLILILIGLVLLYSAFRAYRAEDSPITWYGKKNGEYMFFLQNRNNNALLNTKQLFSGGQVNSPPVVVVDKKKRNFVVWTIREQDSVRMAFRLIDGNRIHQPNFIHPSLRYVMAPHMAVDPSGVIWLTFSGSNGDDDDDIYLSSWSDGEWAPPQRVNTDDDLPDVLPVVGVGRTGEIWVRWLGFDGEQYRQYYSSWNGEQWSREQVRRMPDTLYESANARLKVANMKTRKDPHSESISYFDSEAEIQVWSDIYKQMYQKTW
ncbi:hypothetical protein [Desulfogranum marinum]|uniref:hypothetical protein n=1 Tax=Desulfogranum marinum TaxID=453220 RepID=UPI0029C6B400|nr:hypothetical protein [Desulfogranum marinum]